MQPITAYEIQDMVRHWLETPPNGYLGSSYGAGLKDLLQQPMSAGMADQFIVKMIEDVPILGSLPAGAINIYAEEVGNDSQRIIIDLNGTMITANSDGLIE